MIEVLTAPAPRRRGSRLDRPVRVVPRTAGAGGRLSRSERAVKTPRSNRLRFCRRAWPRRGAFALGIDSTVAPGAVAARRAADPPTSERATVGEGDPARGERELVLMRKEVDPFEEEGACSPGRAPKAVRFTCEGSASNLTEVGRTVAVS